MSERKQRSDLDGTAGVSADRQDQNFTLCTKAVKTFPYSKREFALKSRQQSFLMAYNMVISDAITQYIQAHDLEIEDPLQATSI
jgi:hypothetical protein